MVPTLPLVMGVGWLVYAPCQQADVRRAVMDAVVDRPTRCRPARERPVAAPVRGCRRDIRDRETAQTVQSGSGWGRGGGRQHYRSRPCAGECGTRRGCSEGDAARRGMPIGRGRGRETRIPSCRPRVKSFRPSFSERRQTIRSRLVPPGRSNRRRAPACRCVPRPCNADRYRASASATHPYQASRSNPALDPTSHRRS